MRNFFFLRREGNKKSFGEEREKVISKLILSFSMVLSIVFCAPVQAKDLHSIKKTKSLHDLRKSLNHGDDEDEMFDDLLDKESKDLSLPFKKGASFDGTKGYTFLEKFFSFSFCCCLLEKRLKVFFVRSIFGAAWICRGVQCLVGVAR